GRLGAEEPAGWLGLGPERGAGHRQLVRRGGGAPPLLRCRKERLDTLPQCLPHPALHSAFLSKSVPHVHASASCCTGSVSAGAAISRASARYATAPRELGS